MPSNGRRDTAGVTPVEIIAEIANAHQGDPALAARLADAALANGADAVKFQIYFADELLVERHRRFEHFKRQSFGDATWRTLLADLLGRGARVYCDVFGPRALALALEADVAGVKIHSSDLGNDPLLRTIAATDKRVLLAAGGSTFREIARAVALVRSEFRPRPVLLHGFQSYPTAVEDSRLARITWLREIFGASCDVGYMDHVDGDDPLAAILPIAALGLGVTVIEKHITLDRQARGVDHYSSLNPDEFAAFVAIVRRVEGAIGSDPERFSASEAVYRRQMKKHWVTTRALPAGARLTLADLEMKRADVDSHVPDLENLLGRPLLREVPAEHVVTRADVPHTAWALVVARMRSSRLAGKAMIDVGGMPALGHLLERLKQATMVNRVILCTTTNEEDDVIERLGTDYRVPVFRGAVDDVLTRMLGAIDGSPVDVVVRVTGDDLLVDPDYLDRAIRHHLAVNAEYTDMKPLPSGTEVEVFDAALLRLIASTAVDTQGTEYLTTYVVDHIDQFRATHGPVDESHARNWRLTLDTPADLEVIRQLLDEMRRIGKALTYRLDDIVEFFEARPELLLVNADVRKRALPLAIPTEFAWSRLL